MEKYAVKFKVHGIFKNVIVEAENVQKAIINGRKKIGNVPSIYMECKKIKGV